MGIIIKQSIRSTIIIYIGIVIGAFNVLWLYPKFFTLEQIGLIRVLQDLPFLIALVFRLGSSNLSDRFFSHFRDTENKHNGFLFIILSYPLVGFILFTSVFLLFNDYWSSFFPNSPLLMEYFNFIIPLVFFMIYSDIMESYMRANFITVFPNLTREIILRVMFTFMIIGFAFQLFAFNFLVLYFTFCYGFVLLLLVLYLHHVRLFFLRPHFSFISKELYKEMGTYLLYIIPGTAGSIIAQKIDTLMIGSMKDLKSVGVYSIAYFIGSVVEVPKRSITAISTPLLSRALKDNDLTYVDQLYKKNSITQLLAGTIIFTLIWVNIDDIINLIPNPEKYQDGKYVILLIGLAKLSDMITSINGEIIQISKYFRFNLIALIFLAVVTVVSNLIFIEKYAIVGAALAFLITILLFNFLKTCFLYYQMRLLPFSFKMLHITILTLLILLTSHYLPVGKHTILTSILSISIKSTVVVILYMATIRYFRISEDVNNLLEQIAQKYKIKLPF